MKFLAENGPANAYQIENNANMPYSTVQKALKDMQRKQFIILFAETKNEKGVNAKAYRPTLKGLLAALTYSADLRKTATKWAQLLPLILSKLDYLERHGLKIYVEAFLTDEAKRWRDTVYDQWDDELAQYEVMAHFRDAIFKAFVLDENRMTWFKAIRDDPELRRWAVETLRYEASTVQALRNLVNCELELVGSTAEPNWAKAAQNLQKWLNRLLAHI